MSDDSFCGFDARRIRYFQARPGGMAWTGLALEGSGLMRVAPRYADFIFQDT